MPTALTRWLRGPSRPRPRAPIPGGRPRFVPRAEALEGREVPAVIPGFDIGTGRLTLNGTPFDDTVTVFEDANLVTIYGTASATGASAYPKAIVKEIRFQGYAGNDTFINNGSIPVTADGGAGNDFLQGGSGADYLDGGSGTDRVYGMAGNDAAVYGAGDTYWDEAGENVMIGLAPNWTPRNESPVSGALGAQLSGDTLTLTGPTGAGFQLVGNWQRTPYTSGGLTSEQFTARSTVTLRSALGGIPIPVTPAAPLTFDTRADRWDGFGAVTSVTWTAPWMADLNNSPALKAIADNTGLGAAVTGPGWGISLGDDLGRLGLPVNANVPYLYFSGGLKGELSFGGATASAGTGAGVAFDPADPSLVVNAADVVQMGVSLKGMIPFTPEAAADGATAQVFGNYYAKAAVTLSPFPVTVTGEAVIDFDANDDGRFLGVTSVNALAASMSNPSGLLAMARNAAADAAIGFNGVVSMGVEYGGVSLDLPMNHGTVVVAPGEFSFRGGTVNPFAGTKLAFLDPSATSWDVQGVVRRADDFRFQMAGSTKLFGGLGSASLSLGVSPTGITVNGSLRDTLGVGGMEVTGSVSFTTGVAKLTCFGGFDLDLGIGDANAAFVLDVTVSSAGLSAKFDFSAELDLGVSGFGVSGEIRASGWLTVSGSGVRFSVTGRAYGEVTLFGGSAGIGTSFTFSDAGFSFGLPLGAGTVRVTW
jgi:hypothetical protein